MCGVQLYNTYSTTDGLLAKYCSTAVARQSGVHDRALRFLVVRAEHVIVDDENACVLHLIALDSEVKNYFPSLLVRY